MLWAMPSPKMRQFSLGLCFRTPCSFPNITVFVRIPNTAKVQVDMLPIQKSKFSTCVLSFFVQKGQDILIFSQVFSNKVVSNVARLSRRHLDATMKGSWRELKRGRRELKVSYLPGFYDAYSCRVLSTVFDSKKSNESQMVAWIMAVFTICGYFLGVQA